MIDGIIKLLFAESHATGLVDSKTWENSIHFPVNLGNPHEVPVLDIAKMVLNLTGGKSKIEFKPLQITSHSSPESIQEMNGS
jgi:nucleoside-diphosphate-sugar epimerase